MYPASSVTKMTTCTNSGMHQDLLTSCACGNSLPMRLHALCRSHDRDAASLPGGTVPGGSAGIAAWSSAAEPCCNALSW